MGCQNFPTNKTISNEILSGLQLPIPGTGHWKETKVYIQFHVLIDDKEDVSPWAGITLLWFLTCSNSVPQWTRPCHLHPVIVGWGQGAAWGPRAGRGKWPTERSPYDISLTSSLSSPNERNSQRRQTLAPRLAGKHHWWLNFRKDCPCWCLWVGATNTTKSLRAFASPRSNTC